MELAGGDNNLDQSGFHISVYESGQVSQKQVFFRKKSDGTPGYREILQYH